MEWIFFWVLIIALAATLAVTLFKPERIYEYPFFMAATFAVFIVPQAVSLLRFPGEASAGDIANVLLMCCLCFGMCWVGYRLKPSQLLKATLGRPINPERLFQGALVFIGVSYFFNHLISQMTEEQTGGSQWTGVVTIYGFFAGLIYPAFAICLLTAIRTQSLLAGVSAVVAAIQPLQSTVLAGRREGTVMFLLTVSLTLYYYRGIKPPRLAILFAIVFAMLAIPATGTYRGIAAERDWKQVKQLDLVGNFKTFLNKESILELRNAALIMEVTQEAGDYEYGASYWDQLVFRFVPAQLVGKSLKSSLMFQRSDEHVQKELAKLGYELSSGSTITGMADSFQQFGWFGCLFFAGLGLFFNTLFRATQAPNPIFAQLFYILTATQAMRAVTHQTVDFLPGLVYNVIFLGLLWLYAREPLPGRAKRRGRRAVDGGQMTEDGGSPAAPSSGVIRRTDAPFSVTGRGQTEKNQGENKIEN
jgi:hypothetical protein